MKMESRTHLCRLSTCLYQLTLFYAIPYFLKIRFRSSLLIFPAR